MNKIKNRSGFTLIEMLVALVILICLVIGIGVGMDSGSRVYNDAIFEADSANLAGILNTAIGDILRYSIDIFPNPMDPAKPTEYLKDYSGAYVLPATAPFVFTSFDYGIQNAYFVISSSSGVLQMKNLMDDQVVELINIGAYPDLMISNFAIAFFPSDEDASKPVTTNGYVTVNYTITSASDPKMQRNVEYIVRLMNN